MHDSWTSVFLNDMFVNSYVHDVYLQRELVERVNFIEVIENEIQE